MMGLTLDASRAIADLRKVKERFMEARIQIVTEVGQVVLDRATALVPVDDGTLIGAMTMVVRERKMGAFAAVGPNKRDRDEHRQKPANYAVIVEFGSETVAAQPFLRPAADYAEGQVESIVGRILGGIA